MKKLSHLVIATVALGMVACTGGNKVGYFVTVLKNSVWTMHTLHLI